MTAQGNIVKIVLSFGLVAFLLLGAFGFSHVGMTTGMNGQMIDCPFTPGVSVCIMDPLEMVAASQIFLDTLSEQKDITSLLLLLALAAFALIVIFKPLSPPRFAPARVLFPRGEYIPVSNPLQELFSNGILNPKLY